MNVSFLLVISVIWEGWALIWSGSIEYELPNINKFVAWILNNEASKSLNFWFKTFGAPCMLLGEADSRRRPLHFPSHRACWTVIILTYHRDSLLSSTKPFSSLETRSFPPAWASNSYLGPTYWLNKQVPTINRLHTTVNQHVPTCSHAITFARRCSHVMFQFSIFMS